MKKLVLLNLLWVLSLPVFSQTLILTNNDKQVNSDTIKIKGSFSDGELVQELSVKNTSSQTLSVLLRQEILQSVRGSATAFCWSSCFSNPANPYTSAPINIPADSTNEHSFSSHYDAQGNAGTVLFKYSFYAEGTDTSVVYIQFTVDTSSSTQHISPVSLKVYPNPSSDEITLYASSNIRQVTIEFYNFSGKRVARRYNSVANNEIRMDISSLQTGIYLMLVKSKGKIVYQSKIVKKGI